MQHNDSMALPAVVRPAVCEAGDPGVSQVRPGAEPLHHIAAIDRHLRIVEADNLVRDLRLIQARPDTRYAQLFGSALGALQTMADRYGDRGPLERMEREYAALFPELQPAHESREMWIPEAGRMVRCLCACGFRAFVEGYPSEDLLERHMAEAQR